MSQAPLRFSADVSRPHAGSCPACHARALEYVGTLPYVTTLRKWGLDPERCRSLLHWDPADYSFDLQWCSDCGTWSVPQWSPELAQQIETCAEFYRVHDREYFLGAQPIMDLEKVQSILRAPPGTLDSWNQRFVGVHDAVSRLLSQLPQAKRFLDLGASYGSVARFLEISMPQLEVWACELNPISRMRLSERYPDLRLLGARIENFAPEMKFDLVYCSNVIEHIWELDSFLAGLARILSPNGVALILTPDGECPQLLKEGLEWWGFIVPHHCQIFTRKGLTTALERTGFSVSSMGSESEQEFGVLAKASVGSGLRRS